MNLDKGESRQRARRRIDAFNLEPGKRLANKYTVISQLGSGWEGEVYLVSERGTGIERAAKLFFPQRNPNDKSIRFYAKKLHKLRSCPVLVRYHTHEVIEFEGTLVSVLVSDFVEGDILSDFIAQQPARRLSVFEGLHLLHALAAGMEKIHNLKEYHGDLHPANVMIQRRGLGFEVRILDMFHWGAPTLENIRDDVCDLIRLFYDIIGGKQFYSRQPPEVKAICCGLKRSLICKKFKTAGQVKSYLETMEWS